MINDHLQEIWKLVEIRVLVVASLTIQILLLLLAGYRKRVVSTRYAPEITRDLRALRAHMFHWFLWLTYLLADYVATVGLAYLRTVEDIKSQHLIVFWAPFFLLHLGGQDTITALSIEDNELWSRHLLTLLSQAILAIYNYSVFNLDYGKLWPPAALMFAVGCFKYAERIWALQRASMSALRSSMITKPDPGPNFAKFMQEYTSSIAAKLDAKIIIVEERHKENVESEDNDTQNGSPKYEDIVLKAYEFFPTFKRLFVDLILSYKNREDSQRYFRKLPTKEAYELIEIELFWMYDMLHSKASVIYTITYFGWISRVATLVITTTAMFWFATSHPHHSGYDGADIALTYVLLVAAVGMEIFAFGYMLLSLWALAGMLKKRSLQAEKNERCFGNGIVNYLISIQLKLRPRKKSKWSNEMAQFSLIKYAVEDKPHWWKSVIKGVGFKSTWDNYRYATIVAVSEELKDLVCKELKEKMEYIADKDGYRRCTEHRGQWALQRKGYYKEFGWSVEAEFDESIVLWHIATDLLYEYYRESPSEENPTSPTEENPTSPTEENPKSPSDPREISQHISNYIMFLLIGRPFMMPAGIGQIRFGDTSEEAKIFLQFQEEVEDKVQAVKKILGVSTEYDPADIKGDRSKSLLFSGCKLAHELMDAFTIDKDKKTINWDRMWRLISVVLVEMLCYAASKCSGQFHARQLSKGGELLTVVWFLMAHLGMGEQYRIEQGHARAKLIVPKK